MAESRIINAEWAGCYDDSWKGYIVEEAFAHPAKFSRGLIERIYKHMLAEGMLRRWDTVVDPFGGIGGGGIVAASLGLRWIGCELEQKFVNLATENFAMHLLTWGQFSDPIPRIVQGDSRKLRECLRGVLAEGVVWSPPFTQGYQSGGGINKNGYGHDGADKVGQRTYQALGGERTDGNLETMRLGSIDSIVTSPPFLAARSDTTASTPSAHGGPCQERALTTADATRYADVVVSSPPYAETAVAKSSNGVDLQKQYATYRSQGGGASFEAFTATQAKHSGDYGSSAGQLAALPAGVVDSVVSSPPYEGSLDQGTVNRHERRDFARSQGISNAEHVSPIDMERIGKRSQGDYVATDGQLGAETAETFWSAAKAIVRECFEILKPGGYAAFVVKSFVRDKQIVDFPGDWRKLCEACGFELVQEVRAMLVKEDRHPSLFGGDHVKVTARKSFFRRLYESKYPGNSIDFEVVQFFRKPESP